jgi:hypothetical protein
LHSVLIARTDLEDNDALKITLITHAQLQGMSVLRGAATDTEFKTIIAQRTARDPSKRTFHGVAVVPCSSVHGLVAEQEDAQRCIGDRQFFVLDTDMDQLPNHADIFVTMPRPHATKTPRSTWQKERARLLDLLTANFIPADQFRGGALK